MSSDKWHLSVTLIFNRTALALIKYIEEDILKSSFEEIMMKIANLPKIVDGSKVMEIAWSIPLRRSKIIELESHFAITRYMGTRGED